MPTVHMKLTRAERKAGVDLRDVLKSRKPVSLSNYPTLADEIKDEIDRLHEIKSPKKRLEVARDLIEYIQLHHVDYREGK